MDWGNSSRVRRRKLESWASDPQPQPHSVFMKEGLQPPAQVTRLERQPVPGLRPAPG